MHRVSEAISVLEISSGEIGLLNNQVLIVEGEAGMGKSHLLAQTAIDLLDANGYSLLLLGHTFLTSSPILEQTLQVLNMGTDSETFLDMLEGIGISNQTTVAILIDAINESADHNIWLTGLLGLVDRIAGYDHIKIVISVRTTYKDLVLDNAMQKRVSDGSISRLIHDGFHENVQEAMMQFFDHYHINFGASDYLSYELSNPLLLEMYCATYQEGEIALQSLFDGYVNKIERDVTSQMRTQWPAGWIWDLIKELTQLFTDKGRASVRSLGNQPRLDSFLGNQPGPDSF